MSTGRITVIQAADPLVDEAAARAWLAGAGEPELARGLAVINHALHAFRVVTADPNIHEVAREQALVARVGYGAGEEVAEGRWSDARELTLPARRQRRTAVLAPQARLAAALGGREAVLACAELALRARADLDAGREREAALQLLVALDTALAELALDVHAGALEERVAELRGLRPSVVAAAQAALAGPPGGDAVEAVRGALARLEAALRARAALSA